MRWTCSHIGNNFNRYTGSSESRSIICASRFLKFLYQITCTFYGIWASLSLMISTLNLNCFGSIFFGQIKHLYQFTSLCPCKCHLLLTKWDGLSLTWINNLPALLISEAVLFKWSVIGACSVYIPVNYANGINTPSLLFWLVLYNTFINKCFTSSIYIICVSFRCYLMFYHAVINLRVKKVGVFNQKFQIFVTVIVIVRALLF